MAKLAYVKGATDVTVNVFIQDSSSTTGAGLTGLAYNTASLVAYYAREKAAAVEITLATQTVTGAHSDGGFVEIDATNMPGAYRLDLPDAVLAAGSNSAVVMLKGAADMAPLLLEIQLTDVDLNDATRGGMTALPDANAEAAGGLFTRGSGSGQINQQANGQIDANIERLNNVAQSLLDLTDFADTGYNPSTHKVVGVVTVDTTTTNTDMLTASAVKTAIEAAGSHLTLILADTGTDGVKLADDSIKAATYDESTAYPIKSADAGSTQIARTGADSDTLETISDQIDGIGNQAGTGATEQDITVKDGDGDPIADADVWVTSDSDGTTVVYGTYQTGSDGKPTTQPMLDTGVTYYLWMQKDGVNPINGESFTAE